MIFFQRIYRNLKQPKKWLKLFKIKTVGRLKKDSFTKFVIISRSRSGSNLLRSLLNNHASILSHGEEFRRVKELNWAVRLSQIIYEPQPYFLKAVGFKLFYYHPVDEECNGLWDTIVDDKSIKIIHLTRKKVIRTLISRKIAGITDQWSSYSAKQKISTVSFEKNELIKLIDETLSYEEQTRNKFSHHEILEISYEELVKNQEIVLQSVFQFLGVKPKFSNSVLKKQNSLPTNLAIENYEELISELAGTEYEKYLLD